MKILKALCVSTVLLSNAVYADVNLGAAKEQYKGLINEAIHIIVSKDGAEMTTVLSKLNKAVDLGVTMANAVKMTHPEGKDLLDLSTGSIEAMKGQSLDDIETNWHHGATFKAKGINNDAFDHYGPVIAANDSIVHPVTAIVAIETYMRSSDKDADLLDRAKTELEEIIEQVNYIDK